MPKRPDIEEIKQFHTKLCGKCNNILPISSFGFNKLSPDGYSYYCSSCKRKEEKERVRTKIGLINQTYNNQKKRNTVLYSEDELKEWMLTQTNFHLLYDEWVGSDYNKNKIPSIDRLDDYKPYSIDNIRLVTWEVNNQKGFIDRKNGINNKTNKAVIQKSIDLEIINRFHSLAEAHRITGIHNIHKCCVGKQSTAGGFFWEYEEVVSMDDILEFKQDIKTNKIRKNGVEVKNPSSKEVWKLFERNVAKDFGTTRTPLSGMVKTITNSDTLHRKIYIECKLRGGVSGFPFWKNFEKLRTGTSIECMELMDDDGRLLWLLTRDDFFKLMEPAKFQSNLIKTVLSSKIYKSLLSLYSETTERAEIEGKIPVVAIKKKNEKSYLIGTHPNNFEVLHNILKRGKNVRKI